MTVARGRMSNALKIEKLRATAGTLYAAGQWDEAEKLCRRILELHRTDLAARTMIGEIRLSQGRAAEALAVFDPLVAEAPGDAGIRAQRGRFLEDRFERRDVQAFRPQPLEHALREPLGERRIALPERKEGPARAQRVHALHVRFG